MYPFSLNFEEETGTILTSSKKNFKESEYDEARTILISAEMSIIN